MLTGHRIFIHSAELDRYSYPAHCPFNSSRAGKTLKTAQTMGLLSGSGRVVETPEPATRHELETFHTPAYLDALQRAGKRELDVEAFAMGLGTPDCPVFDGMSEYATLACGATLLGAQRILAGECVAAFNPSGGYHHAHPDRAAGFCYINDIVFGCKALAGEGRKVLFLDIDVHHTDGVQEAFYARRDIMTVSFHEEGKSLFPGTGAVHEIGTGDGEGFSVNVPLPAGTYDQVYMHAFRTLGIPLIEAYNPDVIVLEVGADALAGDPLAHLKLTNNTYAEIVEAILDFDKPVLVTGGGGYHIDNTVRAWTLIWAVLCGDDRHHDMMAGMGGVLLESTDWLGGLRDRTLPPDETLRQNVDAHIERTIDNVRKVVFPYHGL